MRIPLAIALLALAPVALRAQESTARDSVRDTTARDTTYRDAGRAMPVRDTSARTAANRDTSAPEPSVPKSKTVIVRYGFDDGVVEIDVRPGAYISIAGAQGDNAATVTVRGSDARAWTDSTRRMARRAAPRKRTIVVLQRSRIGEASDSGAAVSFIRRAETDSTSFQLFFTNRSSGGFTLALERRETELFFAAMRRAVAVALPSAPKKKTRPKPKPAARTVPAAPPQTPDSTR